MSDNERIAGLEEISAAYSQVWKARAVAARLTQKADSLARDYSKASCLFAPLPPYQCRREPVMLKGSKMRREAANV